VTDTVKGLLDYKACIGRARCVAMSEQEVCGRLNLGPLSTLIQQIHQVTNVDDINGLSMAQA